MPRWCPFDGSNENAPPEERGAFWHYLRRTADESAHRISAIRGEVKGFLLIFLYKKGMMNGMYLLLILGFIVWTGLVIALTCLAMWRRPDDSRELRNQFFYSKSGFEE